LIEVDFWKGYTAAAGVFTMGEVLNGGEALFSIGSRSLVAAEPARADLFFFFFLSL